MPFSWVDRCVTPYSLLFHLLFKIIAYQNHPEPPAHANPHEKPNLRTSYSQVPKNQDPPMATVPKEWKSHSGMCVQGKSLLCEINVIAQAASLLDSSPKAVSSQQKPLH